MNGKKGKTILIVLAAVIVAVFLGMSAWRYFTVVQPAQKAAEEAQQAAAGQGQEPTAQEDSEQSGESAQAAEDTAKNDKDRVVYEGELARLFSVLDNFSWSNSTGQYLEFNDDGTFSNGAQRSDFATQPFELLAIDGDMSGAGGCRAVVSSGENYYILQFVQNTPENTASFEAAPDSDYRIDCALFGDEPFFKVMTDGVTVDGYEFGAPDDVLAHQDEIDAKISELVAQELPAVSKVTWNREASVSYSEIGKTILLMYACNNPSGTIVTVTYTPSTGDIQLFAGNSKNSMVEDKVEVSTDASELSADELPVATMPEDTRQMDITAPDEETQRRWDEAAQQAAARESAQASNEGGNQ